MDEAQSAEVFESILLLVRRHNRTSEPHETVASMIWLEFVQGKYSEIMAKFPDRRVFLNKFVRVRCYRERTGETRRHQKESAGDVLNWVPSTAPNPEEQLLQSEQRERSRSAAMLLTTLPDRREITAARLLMQGKSRRDIQAVLGCSLGTAQNLVRRLRVRPEVIALYKILHGE